MPIIAVLATVLTIGQTSQTADARVDALLAQMTLDEKIGQLSQLFAFGASKQLEEMIAKGQVGSLLFQADPAVINKLQHVAVEKSRLHIPLLFGFDVVHGFRTIFPVPLAMAASWDPSMVSAAQAIAAKEASAVGLNWTFAPMVDIARDPRWGRIMEGAGEDPYLGSAMSAAQVRGFQGDAIGSPDHVLACMKHFAGYGAAEGGRDYDGAYLPDTLLQNVYLPPFHAAVQAGVGSAMAAYMDLNDVPATGNRWLLRDLLRGEWGFKGFVVSDANSVGSLVAHGFAKDSADAAVRALDAGVDMEMALFSNGFMKYLGAAVDSRQITVQQIEAADRAVLAAKIRLGLFEHPYVDRTRAAQILASPEHRTAARLAAERSAVLLRNEGGLLPLKKNGYPKIAVIGPLADSQKDTLGAWSLNPDMKETVTVLAGLRSKVPSVSFAQGVQIIRKTASPFDQLATTKPPAPWTPDQEKDEFSKAVNLAGSSDLTVLVLGEAQIMSGESASRESLALPGNQQQLLEAVVAIGKPVVLVLVNGRPLDIRWASQHVPAILEAWYPGTQGGNAVANLLVGDAVPGGKLPITWPRSVGQVPINYAHNNTHEAQNQGKRYWDGDSTPLYPFGYGLSYSTFRFSNLRVSQSELKIGQSTEVSAEVENLGAITADEVPQLYIHQRYGSASRPVRELKGFQRITLGAHEKKAVRFSLGPNELSYWSAATKGWIEDAAAFDVWVGGDSSAGLHGAFKVTR